MANRIWLGNAVDIKNKWTITIAGTWAAADTITVTINGNDLVLTVGSLVTTAQVATSLKQAWEAETLTDTTASVSPSGGGTAIPEHATITASVSGSVVTLTGDVAGVPHTITASKTSVSGTVTLAEATVATGKNWWSNVDNWSGATVPVAADDVYVDQGAVDILYGLAQSAITLTSLTISQRYTGKIGLPDRNSGGYNEYRAKYLAISATTVNIGQGSGSGSGRIKLDVGAVACTLNVANAGPAAEVGISAILWIGTNAANVVNVAGGTVGIAVLASEVATVATLRQTGGTVLCGLGTTLTTITKQAGDLTTNSAATTVTNESGNATLKAGAHTTITISGGTVYYESVGTITTLTINNAGVVDFERDNRARTVTNTNLNDSGEIRDASDTVTFTNPIVWKGRIKLTSAI